jgi:transposase-like protein
LWQDRSGLRSPCRARCRNWPGRKVVIVDLPEDQGLRAGPSSEERDRIKVLEREVRELRQANEILRKASAYFAMAELDRRPKP